MKKSFAILLIFLLQSLTGQDPMTIGLAFGAFIFIAIMTGMNYMKLRKAITAGEKQTLNTMFRYDIYENHVEIPTAFFQKDVCRTLY